MLSTVAAMPHLASATGLVSDKFDPYISRRVYNAVARGEKGLFSQHLTADHRLRLTSRTGQ